MPQDAAWLALGVMVTELLIVRGFTVTFAVAGSEPALSRTVRVTWVSAATSLGATVKAEPFSTLATGITAWLLEMTV